MSLSLAIITSFIVTVTLMPVIIRVSRSVNLMDQPDKRKIHSISTPSLGGIAIFIGLVIALLIAIPFANLAQEKYFLGGTLLIFLLGVRDDLSSLQARHKLVVQVFSASLVVFVAGIKLGGFHGLFGINTFGWYFDELFTVFVIVVMTNAFNLIDGIDGLAGTIGLLVSLFFCGLFFNLGDFYTATFCLAIAGSILAFLIYNWHPSKVFMGDTGSMMLGFILTVLLVKFLQIPAIDSTLFSPVALVLSLFILPVYDTLRVFLIRFFSGQHPLAPDRNHIHHVLLKSGFNHSQATILLGGFNLLIIGLVFIFQSIGELWLILGMTTTVITIGALLDRRIVRREAARMAKLDASQINMTKSA